MAGGRLFPPAVSSMYHKNSSGVYSIMSFDIIHAHIGFCVSRKPGAKIRRRHIVFG